jgi:hypothetical protein
MALLRSARITLKQHRFEIGAAVIAAVLTGALALWVNARLAAFDVPGNCFPVRLSGANDLTPECSDALKGWQQIIGTLEAFLLLAALAILPFAAGLIAGVPVVGRELELRTAQTAWALAASRRRWFARQLWPILVVFGLVMAFTAAAASAFEATRAAWFLGVLDYLGFHGPLLVARTLAAFGLGLIAGAVLGRTLPALIVGALLSIGLLFLVSTARQGWIEAQPRVELDYAAASTPTFRGMWSDQAWRAPDGRLVSHNDAMSLAPRDGEIDPFDWLSDQGYRPIAFGLTAETLRGWEPLEIAGTVFLGLVLVLWTVAIVDEKRPT